MKELALISLTTTGGRTYTGGGIMQTSDSYKLLCRTKGSLTLVDVVISQIESRSFILDPETGEEMKMILNEVEWKFVKDLKEESKK